MKKCWMHWIQMKMTFLSFVMYSYLASPHAVKNSRVSGISIKVSKKWKSAECTEYKWKWLFEFCYVFLPGEPTCCEKFEGFWYFNQSFKKMSWNKKFRRNFLFQAKNEKVQNTPIQMKWLFTNTFFIILHIPAEFPTVEVYRVKFDVVLYSGNRMMLRHCARSLEQQCWLHISR
jgi:hypothetical protein